MSHKSLRIGVVGVPGGWSSEALADALAAETGFRLLIDMSQVALDLSTKRVMFGKFDLCDLDGIIVKKAGEEYSQDMLDRLEILGYVRDRGVRVFSDPLSILRLLDRLSCTLSLARAGIPLPPTTVTESVEHAIAAIQGYGKAVLKPLYSNKGKGMLLVHARSEAELRQRVEGFKNAGNPLMYIQKQLSLPDRDLGVMFLGGEHIGTYARVKASAGWSTTAREGGRYEPHIAPPDVVALAWRAQSLFQLDLTSVDLVETSDGPIVFEVKAFGGFRGAKEALGMDLAQRYARYALDRVAR